LSIDLELELDELAAGALSAAPDWADDCDDDEDCGADCCDEASCWASATGTTAPAMRTTAASTIARVFMVLNLLGDPWGAIGVPWNAA
jgi:hypothetical protein